MERHCKEIAQIFEEFAITNRHDYRNKAPDELAVIYENLKIVQEEYALSDEAMEAALNAILGEFEDFS